MVCSFLFGAVRCLAGGNAGFWINLTYEKTGRDFSGCAARIGLQ
jgi:hypothetical protein